MSYCVIDLETTIRCPIGNNKASPHWPANKIVAIGFKKSGNTHAIVGDERLATYADADPHYTSTILYVGQNIKFDLLYLLREEAFRTNIWPTLKIWDTQLAEYILTGQQHMWASLDDLAVKYGGTVKDSKIKAYWEAGIDTDMIPKMELHEYLKEDLLNTEIVFLAQIKEAINRGLMPLLTTQMEALLATTEMEYNGMYFETHEAVLELIQLETARKSMEEILQSELYETHKMLVDPNLNSKRQISTFFFGGDIEYVEYEQQYNKDGSVVLYKSGDNKGQPKLKKVTKKLTIPQGIEPTLVRAVQTKTKDYTVDEAVLNRIASLPGLFPKEAHFAAKLLQYRTLDKEISTYYAPYIGLVYPDDGCIHGNLNHCSTATGRLSSTNPNLQNVTNSE